MSITHPTPSAYPNRIPASGELPPFPDDVRAFRDRHGLRDHVVP